MQFNSADKGKRIILALFFATFEIFDNYLILYFVSSIVMYSFEIKCGKKQHFCAYP